MEYKIEKWEAIDLLVHTRVFHAETSDAEIPKFWDNTMLMGSIAGFQVIWEYAHRQKREAMNLNTELAARQQM